MVCAKGQTGINQVYDPDRLLYPLVRIGKRGEGKWKRLSMKGAMDLLAFGGTIAGRKVEGLKSIYESDKPEEFMFHYGRSRIKNAMNHFQKTAFGSGTQGNHTSICETAKWLGNELTMGKHYDVNDAAHLKYILIFGANVLEAHTSHSYLAQRLIEAKAAGAKIVTFDVRLSNTAAKSDEWVPILPGTDLAVILAMTNVVLNETVAGKVLYDEAFVTKWSNVTIDERKSHRRRPDPSRPGRREHLVAGRQASR
jgi:anaerobic selenocysteine-containing dehydrogenase